MSDFKLNVKVRDDLGKGASRRLRREDKYIPAIVYGGDRAPRPIAVEKAAFYKAIEDELFFSSLIDLVVDGKKYQVVVRDLQRHPYKPLVTHADFMRVSAKEIFTMNVPLHVTGQDECVGIKDQDGELHQLMTEVEISCLPKDLPDYLEVDIAKLEVGTTLHLSDVTLPEGVTSVALSHGEEYDYAILNIAKSRVRDEEEIEGEEAAAGEESAEKDQEGGEEEGENKSE
ncbi:50S ribosomal protein L25/general stress protein Ctc [Pistricoccus aurantiacus]|uniref:Large ribosomal subunit protein bL25 n=1 Tax=Pistricoccus aurantiacus TaxID=1883414 RepID=A0A5B8ST12_9GAMM|nr:50S ribosomal protein L25/general stress protein Ctc [Pistricoccus aurantiacus]QEA40252.1 50S ribosomal protein L25/general stress protein Ctc [Pistricoccus aurantiacus]